MVAVNYNMWDLHHDCQQRFTAGLIYTGLKYIHRYVMFIVLQILETTSLLNRQQVFHHRQSLTEQLKDELDPAMALHLATVVLFTVFTQALVHAPGRCVPQLIAFHKQHLSPENHQVLLDCQGMPAATTDIRLACL